MYIFSDHLTIVVILFYTSADCNQCYFLFKINLRWCNRSIVVQATKCMVRLDKWWVFGA